MLDQKAIQISKILNATFTKAELREGLFKQIHSFIRNEQVDLSQRNVPEIILNQASIKNWDKRKMSVFCSLPFIHQELFDAFRQFLPDKVNLIMDTILWEGIVDQEEAKRRFNTTISVKNHENRYYYRDEFYHGVSPEYRIFKVSGLTDFFNYRLESFQLSWPLELRRIIAQYYPKPPEAELIGLNTIDPNCLVYQEGAATIFKEIPFLLNYLSQNNIKVTRRNRPTYNTVPKMQRILGLAEFFPNSSYKSLKHLRSRLIAGLLVHLKPTPKTKIDPPTFIKETLVRKIYMDRYYPSATTILQYLKGIGSLETNHCYPIEPEILAYLKTFPIDQWVDYENVKTHNKYYFNHFIPITPYIAREQLYFEYYQKEDQTRSYPQYKHFINENRIFPGLITPFLKGVFFFFATYGVFDIAYQEPDAQTLGQTYYSPYDELKFVRLTHFGAYVLSLKETYEPPEVKPAYQITLSDHSLTFYLDQENEVIDNLMASYTQKIGARRFQTNAQLFLNDCTSDKDLKNRITFFKHSVGNDLPKNWVDFFASLENRIHPLTKITTYEVFKIPSHQKELAQLLALAPKFRSYILKADNYHLLIPKKLVDQFKTDLKAHGYLMPLWLLRSFGMLKS